MIRMPDSFYDKPEKFKLVPDAKILEPFGFTSRHTFNRGVFFGRKGQLIYEIFSPIDADDFEYDPFNSILTLCDSKLGLSIRIHGIRSLSISSRERRIPRGTLLGTASKIRDLKPGVYVECIITQKALQKKLEARYEALEKQSERNSMKLWSNLQGIDYIEFKHDINMYKRKEKISLLNPYMIVQRESPRRPYACYFNYSALFC